MDTLVMSKSRELVRVVEGQITIEGGGFEVRRPFPTRGLDHVDPFLLLDEAGPIEYKPGEEGGLPDHPHRGFETLTYVLEGEMESHDSTGFSEIFRTGDVEWTTAGRGIIHGGGPTEEAQLHGGHMKGFQIWVNLPKAKKWIAPQSQRITASSIPTVANSEDHYTVRVLGGEAEGVRGPISTTWPITYLHYTVQPGGRVRLTLPSSQRAMLYVFGGTVNVGESGIALGTGNLGLLSDGEGIQFSNASETDAELLVLAAEPINEPVARYGPFVMNTREEVFQAFDDFNAGKFGL